MKRTQIQLDESLYERLRHIAFECKCSISSVIRNILIQALDNVPEQRTQESTFSFIGAGHSGRHDLSERHDEALAEDFE